MLSRGVGVQSLRTNFGPVHINVSSSKILRVNLNSITLKRVYLVPLGVEDEDGEPFTYNWDADVKRTFGVHT